MQDDDHARQFRAGHGPNRRPEPGGGTGPNPEVPPATSIEALVLARRRQAATRALAEARDRRAEAERGSKALKMGEGTGERDGRGGLDPVRYGDWEVKGIATDF